MKKIFFVLLLIVLSTNVSAQTFEASVNRSSMPAGETFLLTLELKDDKTNNTPDFSPLDADFTIYSVANSYRTNIINGNVSKSQQWNLVLMPNKSGELTIPAIKLNNYQSQPLKISVGSETNENVTSSAQAETQKFKIEGKIDNNNPYVQQQINYTLTIYDSGGLQGEAPFFVTNNESDWIIKSLGEPKINSQIVDGKAQREIQFKYALFPQKSGKLMVPPVRFNGYYVTKNRRTDPLGNMFENDLLMTGFAFNDVFATRNPVTLSSKPIDVNVLPAPNQNDNNWWFPAESVKLYAEFTSQPPKFKVGEAVSRNIYLQATGVIESKFPEISFISDPDLKQYPEKPQVEMKVENGKIVSLEKITNVYIPAKAGKLVLPEVSVNWFNVKTRQFEKASIPEMKILVAENPNYQKDLPAQTVAKKTDTNIDDKPNLENLVIPEQSAWKMNILSFLLGIIICFVILKLLSLIRKFKTGYYRQVINMAKNRDLRQLRDAILAWAQNKWPNKKIYSLQDVDELIDNKEFRCELDKLSEILYSNKDAEWNEFLFIKTFKKVDKKHKRTGKYNEPLPKLYK